MEGVELLVWIEGHWQRWGEEPRPGIAGSCGLWLRGTSKAQGLVAGREEYPDRYLVI